MYHIPDGGFGHCWAVLLFIAWDWTIIEMGEGKVRFLDVFIESMW
jgi:hypothetical protein